MNLSPTFQGPITLEPLPADMMDRIAARVESGLLFPGIRKRANYRVLTQDADHIHFLADRWWTAINVGLNDVTIRREDEKTLCLTVAYWGWAGYSIGLGATIVVLIAGAVVLVNAMGYEDSSNAMSSPIFWGSLFFWGLCWPWILIALHKGHARQCLERILREVAGDAQ